MSRAGAILFLVLTMAASLALAMGPRHKREKRETFLYLYQAPKNLAYRSKGPLLPNRVYVKFVARLAQSRWVFVKTTRLARFPEPLQILVAGTVLDGAALGGKGGHAYLLTPHGTWIPTTEREKSVLLVLSTPPVRRTITFLDVPSTKAGDVLPKAPRSKISSRRAAYLPGHLHRN